MLGIRDTMREGRSGKVDQRPARVLPRRRQTVAFTHPGPCRRKPGPSARQGSTGRVLGREMTRRPMSSRARMTIIATMIAIATPAATGSPPARSSSARAAELLPLRRGQALPAAPSPPTATRRGLASWARTRRCSRSAPDVLEVPGSRRPSRGGRQRRGISETRARRLSPRSTRRSARSASGAGGTGLVPFGSAPAAEAGEARTSDPGPCQSSTSSGIACQRAGPLGLEVLRVHEVHAVVDVQLELPAAEPLPDEASPVTPGTAASRRRGGGAVA